MIFLRAVHSITGLIFAEQWTDSKLGFEKMRCDEEGRWKGLQKPCLWHGT
jgi:hypothetical protein